MNRENRIRIAYGKLILKVFEGTMEDLLPIRNENIETINEVMAILPDREQNVLRWRFGLQTGVGLTLKTICNELGVTKERVRQIEKNTLKKLRYRLGKYCYFYSALLQRIDNLIIENQELQGRIDKCESFIKRQDKNWFISNVTKEQAVKAHPILGLKIDKFEFSLRVQNAMIQAGVKDLYDLAVKPESDWLYQKKVGQKTLAEIKEFLSSHKLSFGMKF